MGEYAKYRGQEINIGTCEDMYYLRADQRHLVDYTFELPIDRFRFPFPDEDHIAPGQFEDYDRGYRIPGWRLPEEWAADHGHVQFVASAGYNCCLACPESVADTDPREVDGVKVHRNGWQGGRWQSGFGGRRQTENFAVRMERSFPAPWWPSACGEVERGAIYNRAASIAEAPLCLLCEHLVAKAKKAAA